MHCKIKKKTPSKSVLRCVNLSMYVQFGLISDFWIMKSSQNVIGSIMCCPGCFSLYKLDALRDIVDDYSGPVKNMEDVFTKDTGILYLL